MTCRFCWKQWRDVILVAEMVTEEEEDEDEKREQAVWDDPGHGLRFSWEMR